MLKLEGNAAAVMFVAKGGLRSAGDGWLPKLQLAIAVMAGLSNPSWVREGDVLRIVAELHDTLTAASLLHKPAQSMVDSLVRSYMLTTDKTRPAAPQALLDAMMSNLLVMRIRSDAGVQLVEWTSCLPQDFEMSALELA